MTRADEIAKLSPDELNRKIAEGIGWRWEDGGLGLVWIIPGTSDHPNISSYKDSRFLSQAPPFATSYDAQNATRARCGYDGPVKWLARHLQDRGIPISCDNDDDGWNLKYSEWAGVWAWLNWDARRIAEGGPRASAEAILLAIEKCKEAGNEATES